MTPTFAGTIERRLLVNYRADPDRVAAELPAGFEPQLVGPYAIVGICLIQLRIHIDGLPRFTGLRSRNGAHRISVLDPEGRPAVYIRRRDTASPLVAHLGGRVFTAHHHRARLAIAEHGDDIHITLDSGDHTQHVDVRTTSAPLLPADSVFADVTHASTFFRDATIGYSPNAAGDRLDAVELRATNWAVTPMHIDHVESSYFDDPHRFPAGTIEPDHALLMRDVEHTWHARSPHALDLAAARRTRDLRSAPGTTPAWATPPALR